MEQSGILQNEGEAIGIGVGQLKSEVAGENRSESIGVIGVRTLDGR